jgi:hypothetical protein
MAEERTNIDLLFLNGLKEFEVMPPADVWDNIVPEINGKQKNHLFLRIAASIALVISMGASIYLVTRNVSENLNEATLAPSQVLSPQGSYAGGPENHLSSPVAMVQRSGDTVPQQDITGSDPDYIYNYNLPEANLYRSFLTNENQHREDLTDDTDSPYGIEPSEIQFNHEITLPSEIAGGEKETIRNTRWSIGAMVSPTYYSNFMVGNDEAGENLVSNEKSTVSFSEGVSVSYNLGSRVSLQTGVYYSSLGQKVMGVSSFSGFNKYSDTKGGSDFVIETANGTINTENNDIFIRDNTLGDRVLTNYTMEVFDPFKAQLNYLGSSLLQNISYLEIPFRLKYKVVEGNLGLNIIGGVSYNLLVGNAAYSVSDGAKYYVGKTNGLNPIALSSSLAMGMEYNLSRKFSLNLEPTFRYFITPPGSLTRSSIHPYSFGVFSGVSYKF